MGSAQRPARPRAGPETIEAGGNLAASLSYGDVTMAGVGTATSVCDGKVVGFGHPMSFLGRTTLTMHPADALYIQADSLGAPFKVANLGAPAGTITEDHLTGITGVFGACRQTTDITSSVSYRDRARTGSSHVSVPRGRGRHHVLRARRQPRPGRRRRSWSAPSLLTWTITGHDEDGTPFSLTVTDRYASDCDITFDVRLGGRRLRVVAERDPGCRHRRRHDGLGRQRRQLDVAGRQGRAASRRRVGQDQPAPQGGRQGRRRPGLRALLTSGTDTRTVPLTVAIPKKAAERRAQVYVLGGGYLLVRGLLAAVGGPGEALRQEPRAQRRGRGLVQLVHASFARRADRHE